ncbi:uncharacterized protein I303_104126 [Kwoniella dejecticola CBS 10117]|uniref:Zn(2)-C6 fungal-type domain-containing protein n=1 Tax=Kwoniella dejecticola CBS 10117 TaxID=1296121 RepID=A0A1A6A682_9TREE|nr:uncharacterized protein I303_04895 [Kwoniella dejecticola CBS 10117]OBR85559.1 hypothetical protein I303_04895 [Kwoniella dejecticola CBS 10117]
MSPPTAIPPTPGSGSLQRASPMASSSRISANGNSPASPASSSRPSNDATSQALSPGRKRRKVTRSKLGCLTCRKRRKLCDQNKPNCGACGRLQLECNWPPDDTPRQPSRRSRPSNPPLSPSIVNPPALSIQPAPSIANLLSQTDDPPHPFMMGSSDAMRSFPVTNTMDDFVGIFGNVDGGNSNHQQNGLPHNLNINPPTSSDAATLLDPSIDPHISNNNMPSNDDTGLLDWLSGNGNLDEATLQLWAADCLAVPTAQTFNAFDSLNSVLLQQTPPSTNPVIDPSIIAPVANQESGPMRPIRSRTGSRRPSRSPSGDTPPGSSQAAVLNYFHESLSRLVSCTGESAPSAFESFTKLANMTAGRGPAGQSLHLSILAWAARHMVNRGLAKYEAVSEKFSVQATNHLDTRMDQLFDKRGNERTAAIADHHDKDTEKMTLLAAALMIMQFKICRGDVWGFSPVVQHLTRLAPYVFTSEDLDSQPESMHTSFFENLLYHDVLGSFIFTRAPMVPKSLAQKYSRAGLDTLHTLTGVSLPLFSRMHRLAELIRLRRSRKGKGWSDEHLLDVVKPALQIEAELNEEKTRLDELVLAKPHIQAHRYLHEAFRTACLLQLRCFVLCEPPSSLNIRLLVRQCLSLLEAMFDQNLPGLCSAHWVIFLAALCSIPGGQEEEELDDRQRSDRIYEDIYNEFGFRNVERSRKIVHEQWKKNSDGSNFVDWLDVLGENDWEIFVV